MKRWIWLAAILMITVGVIATRAQQGQLPAGPGDGGAVLRLPGMEPAQPKAPVVPDSMKGLWKQGASPYPTGTPGSKQIALPPSNPVDMNKDIEITPKEGNFVIVVMSYSGEKAPKMARDFVRVLREDYKLPAYVFNHGAEEKRQEYERVQKIRQEQIDALTKAGLKADVPIRVSTMKIDEHTAVLIGGYKTYEDAGNALKNTIRKLPTDALMERGPGGALQPRVDLDASFVSATEVKKGSKAPGKSEVAGLAYINPFQRAFPARNPSLPKEQGPNTSEEDLNFLRKVNKNEPFSLLECKKPYTLAIKQFNMQGKPVRDTQEAKGFLKSFDYLPFTKPLGQWEDLTAKNAHTVAEALRKSGLPDTYVLHCKHCSYITVGGYDSLDDPRLRAMQNFLETGLKHQAYQQLEFFPRPVPMPVPGVSMPMSNASKK